MSLPTERVTPVDLQPERLSAVSRLLSTGPTAAAALIAMLDDRSWVVRREVIAAVASLGDAAVGLLCESLRSDRSDETRIAATVDALVASTGDPQPALAAMIKEDSPALAADVAQILGRRRNPRSVPVLIELMRHPDDNVAVAAIEALGRVGGRTAVDALVLCVESNHFFRVFPAIDVLGRSGDPRAVEPLSRLLHDPRFSLEAARALGRTADRAAVPHLCALLEVPSDGNVRVAALALRELSALHLERYGALFAIEEALAASTTETMIRRLSQCLSSADCAERMALCMLLGASRKSFAMPALLSMLDAQPEVAAIAAAALRKLDGKSADALIDILGEGTSTRRQVLLPLVNQASASKAVALCLSDPDANVRALACAALARIGNTDRVQALFPLLEDDNARVVHAAVAALQSLGSAQTAAGAAMMARSSNVNARRAAIRVLSYFGFESSLEVFRTSLADTDFRVREGAILGLAFLESADARRLLLDVSGHADPRMRAAGMRALGQCTEDTRVVPVLMAALSDPDAWVRYYACQSLGKLAVEAATFALSNMLNDEAGQVRVASIEALSQLRSPLALGALRDAASSQDLDMVRAALLGLSIAQDEQSLPLVLAACAAEDAATRLVALSAAAAFPSPFVLPVLAQMARDVDESVSTAALSFLAARKEREASRLLIELLPTALVKEPVMQALSTVSPTRIPALLSSLEQADDEVASLLASCLARLRHPDAVAALLQALRLPAAAARKAAATTLAALGTREAYSAMAQLATDDPDAEVRRVCALFLAR